MAGANKPTYNGFLGWLRLILVPGIYGIVLSLAFIKFFPKVISYLVQNNMRLSTAVERSFWETVTPFIRIIEGHPVDWVALSLPAVGFAIFVFGYILYNSEDL